MARKAKDTRTFKCNNCGIEKTYNKQWYQNPRKYCSHKCSVEGHRKDRHAKLELKKV